MSTIVTEDPRLAEPYPLSDAQRTQFREAGFIKLSNVLGADVLEDYGAEITRLTLASAPAKPLEQRDTYGKAFIQVGNLWEQSDTVRAFSSAKRLARIAAELLDVDGVRMYHDQALYKEAGGGFTPWHVDQQYWPMSSAKSVTAWIPLHAVPLENGPLCFGKGSHLKNMGRDLEISDESERQIREMIRSEGVLEVFEPYALGDVSFHLGWTLHRAGPNTLDYPRKVHTVIYMDQDMKMAPPKNKNQESDAAKWCPGISVGETMASPRNPVLWSRRH
ncbi:MAG: phytanoyl-CoA dioxygenase family protein [Tepidisphaeraceae bacterium]